MRLLPHADSLLHSSNGRVETVCGHGAAGDRFTRLLPPSQARSFEADTTGQVVHIGMQAQRTETDARPFLRVSFVLTGSPAHEAGLQVGDILHTINGRPAASLNHT